MADTFTATYQVTLHASIKDHATKTSVSASIKRTNPASLNTLGVTVTSAKINMGSTSFWSAASNNPYLDFGSYGRIGVSTSVTDKSGIPLTCPNSSFNLNNLLDVGTSDTSFSIYGSKSTSGNVVTYTSNNATFTITATCTQGYAKSTATVTASVEAGGTSTVTFSNGHLEAVYHKVTWSFGNSSTKSSTTATGAASASYTIPLSWLTEIPNATTGTASVTVQTYASDGTSLGSNTYSFTITAPEAAVPSVSVNGARKNNSVPAAWGVYVQGKSGIVITATASGYQGSTIKSYTISGGTSGTQESNVFTIDPISTSGSVTYTVKVTDSRNRTASASLTISVIAYSAPEFTESVAFRCNSSGKAAENGTYASVKANGTYSTVSGLNTCTLTVRYGLSTSTAFSAATTLTRGTAKVIAGQLDTNASYTILFTLTDALGSTEKRVNLSTAAYTVFFREGGNGVAFGKVSERNNALEISSDWTIYHGDKVLGGVTPVSQGGTGATTVAGARNALGLGNTNGALPVANGGTGATTAAGARNALGLGNTNGALPIANGGTGASDAATARSNLGITLSGLGAAASSHNHSAGNITSGTLDAARLPFKVAYGTVSCSGSSAGYINYSGAGFTSTPVVVVSYSTTSSNWSGDNGALKVYSKNTSGASVIVGGSFNTSRLVDWIAIGT